MEFTFNQSKDDVLQKLKNDINSNNRYVGDGWKIAGKIDENKIHLNLEDRMSKSSKFANEVFYGRISTENKKTIISGKFRFDTYPLILLLVLFFVALESVIAGIVIKGITGDMIFPSLIAVVVVLYYIYVKKRSKETNRYIENYLKSIEEL